MKAIVIKEIIEGVDGLDADEEAKQQFIQLVSRISGAHGAQAAALAARISFTRRLLALKVSRATVRERLMALYGVSRRQAYRDIDSAL